MCVVKRVRLQTALEVRHSEKANKTWRSRGTSSMRKVIKSDTISRFCTDQRNPTISGESR